MSERHADRTASPALRWLAIAAGVPAVVAFALGSILALTAGLAWSAAVAHAAIGALCGALTAGFAHLVARPHGTTGARVHGAAGTVLFLLLFASDIGSWIARRSWGRNLAGSILVDFFSQTGELTAVVGWRVPLLLAGWIAISVLVGGLWARRLVHCERGMKRPSRVAALASGLAAAALALAVARPGTAEAPSAFANDPLLSLFQVGQRPDLPLTGARLDAWARDERLRHTFDAGTPTRRHLVLILSDGVRPDRMSVSGYPRPTTPFLESLAKSPGWAQVPRAYSAATESLGGIGSIIAGRSPRTMSARSYGIVEFLARHGFRTHLLLNGEHDWYELRTIYGSRTTTYRDMRDRSPDIALHDDRQILRWLDDVPPADDKPGFVMIFLMGTHQTAPLSPEDALFTRKAGEASLPFFFQPSNAAEWKAVGDRYDDQLHAMDRRIAEIWRVLGDKGYLEDCVAVFSSDHGQMLGEHGMFGHGSSVYEEGVRIPLMLWSDRPLPPVNTDRIAWSPDIAPTLAEAAGLRALPGWEGLSLFSSAPRDRLWIDSVQWTNLASASLLEDGEHLWKLARRLDDDGQILSEAVYDVAADPSETRDVSSTIPAHALATLRSLAGGYDRDDAASRDGRSR